MIFCQALFLEAFRSFRTCGSFFNGSILVLSLCFCRFQKSFFLAALGAQVLYHIPTRLATPFFTFFVPFCVFDFLTSFLTVIYTFLDVEVSAASEVIFLYIMRYCSIQTSREVYTAVDITPRNANTFLAQFVKSFGLKFCSKILGSILAKPPKHKM